MSSRIRTRWTGCALIAVALMVSACGGPDATSTFDPETAVHPSDWLPAGHVSPARENSDSCKQCHGEDLVSGGISGVSCDSCHLGGPLAVHPETWDGVSWSEGGHGLYVVQSGTSVCRNIWCHGANLEGVSQSGPSCNDCHPYAAP
jgi:hypothetical protein